MDQFLNKLSSYNIFNYLLPGIIFIYAAEIITHIELTKNQLVISFFLFYFYGLVISRVGAMILEPCLTFLKIIKKHSYTDFLIASKKDAKIEILLEVRNMYRTLCALFFIIGIIYFFQTDYPTLHLAHDQYLLPLIIFLFSLFLISFYRQNNLLFQRISTINTFNPT
jgi:hypothetical protein